MYKKYRLEKKTCMYTLIKTEATVNVPRNGLIFDRVVRVDDAPADIDSDGLSKEEDPMERNVLYTHFRGRCLAFKYTKKVSCYDHER